MEQARWRQIDDVLERVLELAPEDRAGALTWWCADDEDLRQRVESLLGEALAAEPFLEASAFEYLAREIADEIVSLTPGQRIGRFRIEHLIGAGGMGEVYLAEDPLLGRKVAIKLLPAHFDASPERVSRFEREARAAGSLSHENIVRVFDVGEFDGRHYLVTEHVAGETLRERMAGKPMNALEAVSIARQIAVALLGAHDASVVHRDIKPENIMVQRDGIVKVLDFSLALLVGDELQERASGEAAAQSAGSEYATRFGAVMGTLRYMSPEQARGEPVDHRTDLFSLGIVLYEMIAGRTPFVGPDRATVIAAILEQEAPPLDPSVPGPLRRVIAHALEKDRERRYPSAAAMLQDLKAFQERLKQPVLPPPLSLPRPARWSRRAWIAAGSAAAIVSAASAGIWQLVKRREEEPPEMPPEIQAIRLDAVVEEAAISSDGRRVAFTIWEGNRRQLRVGDLATGKSIEVLPPDFSRDCLSPTFAPDGRSIYFLASEGGRNSLYHVPANGGIPGKIIDRLDSPVAVSPDGRRLAFMRVSDDGLETALMIADEQGGGARQLAARRDPIRIVSRKPAWSPDGGRIAFAAGTPRGPMSDHQIHEVSADGGAEQLLSKHRLRGVDDLVWLNGEMAVLGSQPDYVVGRVWHLSFVGDRLRDLTKKEASVSCGFETLSTTASGGELFSLRWTVSSRLQVMPAFDSDRAKLLGPVGEITGGEGICWTPEGRIVYAGGRAQSQQIRMVDPDGANDRAVTSGEHDSDGPFVTHDGRYLVYCMKRDSGDMNIWRMDRRDGSLRQLTYGREDVGPRCSPDSQWVVFIAKSESTGASIRRVSIEGGQTVPLAADCKANPSPTISPDGTRVAYFRRISGQAGKQIEVIPLHDSRPTGSPPLKIFQMSNSAYHPHWSNDGRSILYAQTDERTTNLWELSYETGDRKQLTHFDSGIIAWFSLSFDGRQVALSRVTTNREVVRIGNFT